MLKNSNDKSSKRKPSEKRKKKSRDAARSRRSKESEIFQEILELIPLPRKIVSNLDKGAAMRMFISYIHLRQFILNMNFSEVSGCTYKDAVANTLYGEAIDGFVLILSVSGHIIYLSESVDKYLGISQVDLLGQSLFDFSHPCDHEDIRGMLAVDHCSISSKHRLLRMKCSVSKRETKVKPASYKVIRCVGRVVNDKECSKQQDDSNQNVNFHSLKFVSIASPIPHPSNIETFLGQTTFLSRHNSDMKFTYIDSRISELMHYEEKELLNKSLYLFIHPLDIHQITISFKELFKKGQCDTDVYRFMVSDGGFVWIVTQATLIYDKNNNNNNNSRNSSQTHMQKSSTSPQCVVCVHYVNSKIIGKDEIIADHQIKPVAPLSSSPDNNYNSIDNHVPLQSTDSIFSPRTPQDMNTGYLSINDIGATKHQDFRDDPDDLTHLAPTPGDACIPIDISSFSDENLEKWMLMDPQSCQEELSPFSDTLSLLSDLSHSPLRNDPFLSYRDDMVSCDDDKSHELFKDITSSACNYEQDNRALNQVSPPEQLLDDDEGFSSLPIGDFPSLSVTDSILWSNSTDQSFLSSKIHEPNEELSAVKYSNLARLLQGENTEKSMCNIKGFTECKDLKKHDTSPNKSKIAHQAKRGDHSTNQKAQYTSKNCHRSPCCDEKRSEKYSCDKNTLKLPITNLGKNCPCAVKKDENNEQSTLKRHSNEVQKSKVKKKVKRHQNNMPNENKDSVLMNLLMKGHNSSSEYSYNGIQQASKLITTNTSKRKDFSKSNENISTATTLAQLLLSDTDRSTSKNPINNFVYLTREDAEVNAPTQSRDGLLAGKDLLNALELGDNNNDSGATAKVHAPT